MSVRSPRDIGSRYCSLAYTMHEGLVGLVQGEEVSIPKGAWPPIHELFTNAVIAAHLFRDKGKLPTPVQSTSYLLVADHLLLAEGPRDENMSIYTEGMYARVERFKGLLERIEKRPISALDVPDLTAMATFFECLAHASHERAYYKQCSGETSKYAYR